MRCPGYLPRRAGKYSAGDRNNTRQRRPITAVMGAGHHHQQVVDGELLQKAVIQIKHDHADQQAKIRAL